MFCYSPDAHATRTQDVLHDVSTAVTNEATDLPAAIDTMCHFSALHCYGTGPYDDTADAGVVLESSWDLLAVFGKSLECILQKQRCLTCPLWRGSMITLARHATVH
jgi:hypothetical protein